MKTITYWKFLIGASFLVISQTRLCAQIFDVDTLQYNGSTDRYINLVIMGDGFTSTQINNYKTEAISFRNYFLNNQPFSNYKNYFNIFSINVISEESGVKHPRTAPDCSTLPISNPNTYLESTFDTYNIHRLVTISESSVVQVLANNFPVYDLAIVLANSTEYGGSGGSFAVSTIHPDSKEIALHELGHSFGLLADEYWAGSIYANEFENMTANNNPATIRWKNWLNTGSGISIHQHTGYNWYKPTNNSCKMQALNKGFCAVCKESFIERIHNLASPVLGFFPETTNTITISGNLFFKLDLIKPIPNTLKTKWLLDLQQIALNKDSVQILFAGLSPGTHQLQADIEDTTKSVKTTIHSFSHKHIVQWNLMKSITGTELLNSVQSSFQFGIFPNPGKAQITISFQSNYNRDAELRIFSMAGKEVKKINLKPNQAIIQDVDLWPSGMYNFLLSDGIFRYAETWVKE